MKRNIRIYLVFEKKICQEKRKGMGKKMNPLSLFKPFSSILEEIVKY